MSHVTLRQATRARLDAIYVADPSESIYVATNQLTRRKPEPTAPRRIGGWSRPMEEFRGHELTSEGPADVSRQLAVSVEPVYPAMWVLLSLLCGLHESFARKTWSRQGTEVD